MIESRQSLNKKGNMNINKLLTRIKNSLTRMKKLTLEIINPSDYIKAHKSSINNESQIKSSNVCGCFHCMNTYSSAYVSTFVNLGEGNTALCPNCRVDSVIGDAQHNITDKLLVKMNKYWFNE